jgi:hypothetical protein
MGGSATTLDDVALDLREGRALSELALSPLTKPVYEGETVGAAAPWVTRSARTQ